MANELTELSAPDDLGPLLADSSIRPVLIYKHSLTCGTSAAAFEEIRDLAEGPPIGARIVLVRVQAARALSNAIANQLGVRHETPQVLLVRDGRLLWHASHFRVTSDAIAGALKRFGALSGTP